MIFDSCKGVFFNMNCIQFTHFPTTFQLPSPGDTDGAALVGTEDNKPKAKNTKENNDLDFIFVFKKIYV